jgi:4'-phosphopantetheinyl transferase
LHIPKRRDDWRLGRWTAKRAVARVLDLPNGDRPDQNIEIPADPSGAPRVLLRRRPVALSISLSHRDGVAACAIARSTIPLGCDLELIEPRSDAFIADYFTKDEQKLIALQSKDKRDEIITVLWSAKESALKALRVGLTVDTRSVSVCLGARHSESAEKRDGKELHPLSSACPSPDWRPFQATFQNEQILYGWWSTSTSLVRTFASVESLGAPFILSADRLDYSPCIP